MKKDTLVANEHPRMTRERRTVEAMVQVYCLGQHGRGQHALAGGLCADCQALRDYAWQRLQKCSYQEGKTTCAKCPIHCYRPEMRARIRTVMRYAGPRMLVRHPLMALQHMVDGFRNEPIRSPKTEIGRAKKIKRART